MNLCQEKLLIKTNTYFPNIKDKIYVTVFMEDVNSLNDNNWLTNSAVDFYIRGMTILLYINLILILIIIIHIRKKKTNRFLYEKYTGDISIQILTSIEYYIIENKKLECN